MLNPKKSQMKTFPIPLVFNKRPIKTSQYFSRVSIPSSNGIIYTNISISKKILLHFFTDFFPIESVWKYSFLQSHFSWVLLANNPAKFPNTQTMDTSWCYQRLNLYTCKYFSIYKIVKSFPLFVCLGYLQKIMKISKIGLRFLSEGQKQRE